RSGGGGGQSVWADRAQRARPAAGRPVAGAEHAGRGYPVGRRHPVGGQAMSAAIRILVADDHPVVRDGLAAILGTQPDFAVVGTAATGREALAAAVAQQPDVLLLDLEMPEIDGVTVIRTLHKAQPAIAVVVFTAFDTDERILDAVRAGAR